MSANRIIYYYQTFNTLKPLIQNPKIATHIHLSAIHFGNNPDKSPYIHLNDHSPNDPTFDNMWKEIEELKLASKNEIQIVLMIGGAGGAFTDLFTDFETYYKLLHDTIKSYPVITGVDLDIEEYVEIDDVKMLIDRLDKDFGSDFIIAMAPVSGSFEYEKVSLEKLGFSYKDLYNSAEGQRVNYFNGQFYGTFDFNSYQNVIADGYPANKVVIGMISGEFAGDRFKDALSILNQIKIVHSDFGGTFVWEYFDSPPEGASNPSKWAEEIYALFNSELFRKLSGIEDSEEGEKETARDETFDNFGECELSHEEDTMEKVTKVYNKVYKKSTKLIKKGVKKAKYYYKKLSSKFFS